MLEKTYDEETKAKYVAGFKNCTLTLRDYAEKMKIAPEDLKVWLKEVKSPESFGKINLSELDSTPATPSLGVTGSIKFECDSIKLELKENYDKVFLSKLLEVLIYAK